jgi:hypothetical protein
METKKLTMQIYKSLYRLCKIYDKYPKYKLLIKKYYNEEKFKDYVFGSMKISRPLLYKPQKDFVKILNETIRLKKGSPEDFKEAFDALKYMNQTKLFASQKGKTMSDLFEQQIERKDIPSCSLSITTELEPGNLLLSSPYNTVHNKHIIMILEKKEKLKLIVLNEVKHSDNITTAQLFKGGDQNTKNNIILYQNSIEGLESEVKIREGLYYATFVDADKIPEQLENNLIYIGYISRTPKEVQTVIGKFLILLRFWKLVSC